MPRGLVGRGESETKVERGSARSLGLRLGVWTGRACVGAGAWGCVAERGRYSARVRPGFGLVGAGAVAGAWGCVAERAGIPASEACGEGRLSRNPDEGVPKRA